MSRISSGFFPASLKLACLVWAGAMSPAHSADAPTAQKPLATASAPAPTASAALSASAPACPPIARLQEVRVTRAGPVVSTGGKRDDAASANEAAKTATTGGVPSVHLRGGIEVGVEKLQVLSDLATCTGTKRKIVLFLDGRPLPDLVPYPPTLPEGNVLNFELRRDEASRDVWTHLLGHPTMAARETVVSVGFADGYPVASDAIVRFEIIDIVMLCTWLALLLVLALIFGRMASKSDMLRDVGLEPTNGGRKSFSLSRVQAAFWFFLFVVSYAFIGLITGDYESTITGTVLALMGISAGTAIGSSLLDADSTRARPPGAPASASRGFLQDVLSDDGGVNFHRFQMFAWTLVLGVVFLHEVWANLAMPEFNGTLLGLLGISSGTYLGLKTTSEKAT